MAPVLLLCLLGCTRTGTFAGVDTGPEHGVIVPDDTPGVGACDAARDEDGDGWDAPGDGGTDCDDFDATVNPAMVDDVVDGIDANCDGVDAPEAPAECVPTLEICDGVDQDCDGRID